MDIISVIIISECTNGGNSLYQIKILNKGKVDVEFIQDYERVMDRLETLLLRSDHPRIHITYKAYTVHGKRVEKEPWHWIGQPVVIPGTGTTDASKS